jgi:hypothetical protein
MEIRDTDNWKDFEIIGVRKYDENEEYKWNTHRSTRTDLDVMKTV